MFVSKNKYQEKIDLVKGNIRFYHSQKKEELDQEALELISEKKGNPLACMGSLSQKYEVNASKNLLFEYDMKSHRQNAYICAKLYNILSKESRGILRGGTILQLFLAFTSNNPDLKNFLLRNLDIIAPELKITNDRAHILLSRTILLAWGGKWEEIIRLSNLYLEKPLSKPSLKYFPIHFSFLKSLAKKDISAMKEQINLMLEPKIARQMMNDMSPWFDFYLHMYVIIYAKIALAHGIDLEIDSEVVPKELIDNTPLDEYPEPYEFMKEFDLKTFTAEDWKAWIYRYHPNPESLDRSQEKGFFV